MCVVKFANLVGLQILNNILLKKGEVNFSFYNIFYLKRILYVTPKPTL